MLQPALDRDGIEPVAYGISAPKYFDAMEPCQLSFEDRGNRENAFTRTSKLPEELGVLEFADDIRPNVNAIEPLIDGAANRGIRRLEK